MDVTGKFSDEELINSLKTGAGRNDAIRFIYKNHFGPLEGFILNNSGSQQDAEDIFQEVVVNFISLVQMDKFRGESNIKTFLFSMNRFTWFNELKKRNRAAVRETKYEKMRPQQEPAFSHTLTDRETTAQVFSLVEELGEVCKKILVMFYYENSTMKEILEHTGYENEQVVRNKKYKCLKQLEKMITEKPALKTILKSLLHG